MEERIKKELELHSDGYLKGMAAAKKNFEEKEKTYKELIDSLLQELYTSRAYHLGITGLDSDAERARKEREGNTALIHGIDSTIKYVKDTLKDL